MVAIDDASPNDKREFASYLVSDTVKRITGRHVDDGDRTPPGFTPRTNFFSGALAPESDEEDSKMDEEVESRMSPSSLGLIGRVTDTGDNTTVSIQINLSFALYYRVLPTINERVEANEKAPTVYRKCRVGRLGEELDADDQAEQFAVKTTVTFDARSDDTGLKEQISTEVETELNRQISAIIEDRIKTDPLLFEGDVEAIDGFLSAREDLSDEELIQELADAAIGGDSDYIPEPEIGVEVRLLEGLDETAATVAKPGSALVRVDILNESDAEKDFEEVDLATYETQLELRGTDGTEFQAVTFEDVPSGFRYESSVPGQGHNCTAEWIFDDQDNPVGIKSVTVPVYEQDYFKHKRFSGKADPKFERLVEDPLPVLRAIRRELKAYKDNEWGDRLEKEKREAANPADDPVVEEIEQGIEEFEREIERFDRGVGILEDDEEARELFKQTNRVFLRKVREGDPWDSDADLEYKRWRPFQIVFIVSLLPDILSDERSFDASMHNREKVDLLYFPTGGGKTEAYLALIVFTALFDRRRGKQFGISTMMRFPLRLLTLQQFQRIVEVLTHADEVRKEEEYGGDPFSAGFFTGNTENQLKNLLEIEFEGWYPDYPNDLGTLADNRLKVEEFADRWNQVGDNDLVHINRGDYRAVENCPLCGANIELVFNIDTDRIEHHCSADSDVCHRDKLNVHVTDIDIYRSVPTIVVGTQDKLAALGYNYRCRTLAGYITHKCPEHGYTFSKTDCQMTRYCGRDDDTTRDEDGGLDRVALYDPSPTLVIQDELHLLNEELGTFESHYYTAYEQHLEWAAESYGFDFQEPKKIAATATIEKSDHQVKHLYGEQDGKGKDSIRFPAPGPDYRESAYTTTDEDRVDRFYIGVTPWNRTQINSIIRVLELHQRRMQDWLEDPQSALQTLQNEGVDFDRLSDPDDFETLLEHYYTLVTYVISKFESGRLYKSTETQVNDNLTSDGYDSVDRFDMQGNTDPDKMAEMLDKFEQLGEEDGTTYEDLEGLVTATKSISHGVDIDALGFMLFFNAPPRMSEYIQASSRVGRRHPGIVLDMFDPVGERDRSHYHYFNKYHEYLDRLVEPVAINRWAKFSVGKTFPGLFMSLLNLRYFDDLVEELGYFSNRPRSSRVKKALQNGVIDQDQIIDDLLEIYGEDWEVPGCPFEERVEELVQQSFSRIQSGEEEYLTNALIGRVMLSFRDVDEMVTISPSKNDKEAFQSVGVDMQ